MGVQIIVRVGIETEDLWMCLFLKMGMLMFSMRSIFRVFAYVVSALAFLDHWTAERRVHVHSTCSRKRGIYVQCVSTCESP